MSTGKLIILCVTAMFMALLGVGIAMGGSQQPTTAPQQPAAIQPGTTTPTDTVQSYNDGFLDGMKNAQEVGPSGVTQWLNATPTNH